MVQQIKSYFAANGTALSTGGDLQEGVSGKSTGESAVGVDADVDIDVDADADAAAQESGGGELAVFSESLKASCIALSEGGLVATATDANRDSVMVPLCLCSDVASNGNYVEFEIISCIAGSNSEFVGIGVGDDAYFNPCASR